MKKLLINTCILLTTIGAIAGNSDTTALEGEPTANTEATRKNRNCFKKGTQIVTVGYGIPGLRKSQFGDFDEIYPTADFGGLGPIFLKYEYAIGDKWGLGLVTRFTNSKVSYPIEGPLYNDEQEPIPGDSIYTYTQSFMSIGAMARGNLHFGTSHNWDHYAGIGLGYGNSRYKIDLGGNFAGSDATIAAPIAIAWEATIGTRYYFSETVGAYAELGFSQSILNGGFVFKF